MHYEDMTSKAKLYQEANKVLNQKPQLIQEGQAKVVKLEKAIADLEEKAAKVALNESMNKINPLKFFVKDKEDYENKITKLENELKREKRKIESLENATMEDLIDLEAIIVEASQIMAEQREVVAAYKQKVLSAQAAYHKSIEEYQKELNNQQSFAMRIQSLEKTVREETFVPTYPREQPPIDNRLKLEYFSPEITTKHRQRPSLKITLLG